MRLLRRLGINALYKARQKKHSSIKPGRIVSSLHPNLSGLIQRKANEVIVWSNDGHLLMHRQKLLRGGMPVQLEKLYAPNGKVIAQEADLKYVRPRDHPEHFNTKLLAELYDIAEPQKNRQRTNYAINGELGEYRYHIGFNRGEVYEIWVVFKEGSREIKRHLGFNHQGKIDQEWEIVRYQQKS